MRGRPSGHTVAGHSGNRRCRQPVETPSAVRRRAHKAWEVENERRRKEAEEQGVEPMLLTPIGLHQCRHTC
jgi:hypothetical protein